MPKNSPSSQPSASSPSSPPLPPSKTVSLQQSETVDETDDVKKLIDELLLENHGIESCEDLATKGGWDLRQALVDVAKVGDRQLLPHIQEHGVPAFYLPSSDSRRCRHASPTSAAAKSKASNDGNAESTDDDTNKADASAAEPTKPKNCFQSLCRIVTGQQLTNKVAEVMYSRLLQATGNDLRPEVIIKLAEENFETRLRKPSSMSNSKARCLVEVSKAFQSGLVSEEFLRKGVASNLATGQDRAGRDESDGDDNGDNDDDWEQDVRSRLLQIKGIGPWTCDIFLMFYLEQPDVLPLGDLGIRRGIALYFGLTNGKERGGGLCQKKDKGRMVEAMREYQPFRSILCCYLWRNLDSTSKKDKKKKKKKAKKTNSADNKRKAKVSNADADADDGKRKRRKVKSEDDTTDGGTATGESPKKKQTASARPAPANAAGTLRRSKRLRQA